MWGLLECFSVGALLVVSVHCSDQPVAQVRRLLTLEDTIARVLCNMRRSHLRAWEAIRT